MPKPIKYIVITPARNEEENIAHTIQSMREQSILPLQWIIVNDGSTDGTKSIIDRSASDLNWVTPLHRPDRGYRQQGGGVIEAFNDGYKSLQHSDWDYLIKFDADLSFDIDYFELCFEKFVANPKLGIGGGMICFEAEGLLHCESPKDPSFHVRGATKIYSRKCWESIGALFQAPGWDTIDELKANMNGFNTYTFKDIPLRHHRFTGTVDGTWKNYVKFGISNYVTGYSPYFMLLKCLKRIFQRPHLIGPLALWWGFCKGYFTSIKQVDDPDLIRYTRNQQWNKLLGKPSLW
jgi:poly-beta-1,6-N-acetyl-D-glucosamine synthase